MNSWNYRPAVGLGDDLSDAAAGSAFLRAQAAVNQAFQPTGTFTSPPKVVHLQITNPSASSSATAPVAAPGMSAGAKVAIGVGIAGVVGAIGWFVYKS